MPQQASAAEQVTIVTVSYSSLTDLPEMLASVTKGARVVVVDNASSDQAALKTPCDQRGGGCIQNDRNIGFGPACNLGAKGGVDRVPLVFSTPMRR